MSRHLTIFFGYVNFTKYTYVSVIFRGIVLYVSVYVLICRMHMRAFEFRRLLRTVKVNSPWSDCRTTFFREGLPQVNETSCFIARLLPCLHLPPASPRRLLYGIILCPMAKKIPQKSSSKNSSAFHSPRSDASGCLLQFCRSEIALSRPYAFSPKRLISKATLERGKTFHSY